MTRTATPTQLAESVNITNKPEVIAAIRQAAEYKRIEAEGKAAEAARKILEEEVIRPALGGAVKGILRGVVAVQLQASSNSGINAKALLEAFPEAHAATFRRTPYTFLKYNL